MNNSWYLHFFARNIKALHLRSSYDHLQHTDITFFQMIVLPKWLNAFQQHLKLLLAFFHYFFCTNNTDSSKVGHFEYFVASRHNKCLLYRNVPRLRLDMSKVVDDSDLKMLLLQTTSKSLIVVEDLDRYLDHKSTRSTAVSHSGLLNFMDGIISSCGEKRVLVFTMSGKEHVDGLVMRPGRVDVHIHFLLCDFTAFKSLASTYLGVKEHKLFPQVEEIFQSGGSLTAAEIGEIMISNRSSPSRALKTVITALQTDVVSKTTVKVAQALTSSGSGRSEEGEGGSAVFCRESVHTVSEFRKLYGLLRLGSRRKEEPPVPLPLDRSSSEKEGSRHERIIV